MKHIDKETVQQRMLIKRTELNQAWIECLKSEIDHLRACVQVFAFMCLFLLVMQGVFILVWALS